MLYNSIQGYNSSLTMLGASGNSQSNSNPGNQSPVEDLNQATNDLDDDIPF